MYFLVLLFSCLQPLERLPEDFPDNPNHDFDGDGLLDFEDCDDNNPSVGPKVLYYPDLDLDGFPSDENAKETCPSDRLEGYLLPPENPDDFDCDDTDPSLNPLDLDQDGLSSCEGDCDDYRADIILPVPYYQDSDGDGFGSQMVEVVVCPAAKPVGYVSASEAVFDCDDSNAEVYPEAQEFCDDNLDNDCDGFIDNYDGLDAPQWYQDSDNDGFGNVDVMAYACVQPEGYVSTFGDCDDSNALVFPDAIEYCDGLDNNCNTVVDESSAEDAVLWYADDDNDGFGSPINVQKACSQPSGYLSSSNDCNDSNSSIHPNAIEMCNGLDDNCSGDVDEGVDGTAPLDAATWYLDSDNDGFGSAISTRIQCNQPQGYLADSNDCDDMNAAIYPGADEYCNGIDDSCSGSIDDGSVDAPTWFLDGDGDGFGTDIQVIEACEAPSGFVDNVDDCDDGNSDRYLGALEYCNGLDDNCNGLVDESTAVDAIAYYPDQDGDGYGQAVQPWMSCVPVAGMVGNNDDCDDILAQVSPSALEYCNGFDDDCNGQVDDAAVDQVELYLDADGDGHGTGVVIESSCGTIDSFGNITYSANRSVYSDDCDDQDANRYPSAQELCSETIDENCDNDPIAGAVDGDLYFADGDGDGFGSPNISLRFCTVPVGYVSDSSDCNDSDASVFPYVLDESDPAWVDEELCNGKVDRCQNDLGGDLSPPIDEQDLDGDGYVECALDIAPEAWEDQSTIVFGGSDCEPFDNTVHPNALELCNGLVEDCNLTSVPETEVDDDGDGYVECTGFDISDWQGDSAVIGGDDCNDSSDVTYMGAAFISHPDECATDIDFDGMADKSWELCSDERNSEDRRLTIYGAAAAGLLGYSTTKIPDFDNDGIDELAISAPNTNVGQGLKVGTVYIFLGSTLAQLTGEVSAETADYIIYGENSSDYFGRYIKGLDLNEDGVGDLLIAKDHGVHIFLGGTILSGPSVSYAGNSNQFIDGYSVSFIARDGDIDGNGTDELLFFNYVNVYWMDIGDLQSLSNPTFENHHVQKSYYFPYFGSEYSSYNYGASDFDGDGFLDYVRFGAPSLSASQYNIMGYVTGSYDSASAQGNINGDLIPDLVGSYNNQGVTHVYIGSGNRLEIEIEGAPGFVGDIDQDGLDDIVISESLQDYSYVYLGSTLSSGSTSFTVEDADFVLEGSGATTWHHERLDDIDGDGFDDVSLMNHLDGTYTPLGGTLSVYSGCSY